MSNIINAAGEATESVILNITRQIGEAAGRRDDQDVQIAALRDELSQHKTC